MIRSFKSRWAEEIWHGEVVRRLPQEIQEVARRKLRLADLRVPPGNRLEALKGNRAGQHSIRINASSGEGTTPTKWRSWTTTEEQP